ncbi:Hpt domain-containing protein [Maridesulfovibrio sp.]|uniref:Hpt domain-containing protein n=1 Tax=Maridesulfovibrio sp. TaxID=2795000 RepID=UPI0039EE0A39
MRIVEKIDKDLKVLIPGFMEITQQEIEDLRQALDSGDLKSTARIGHNIKGSALNYGFQHLGDIGLRIESQSVQQNIDGVRAEFESLKKYVEQVEVEYY